LRDGRRPGRPAFLPVSLVRALSKLGVASRTEAARLIAAGRVRVDGRLVRDGGLRVDLDRCRIELDGAVIRRTELLWLMLHKPLGVVTTMADELGRPSVRSLIPASVRSYVAPVGRLDIESSGLLLLTNDTRLAARLTAPDSGCAKVYEVVLDRPLVRADLDAFRRGLRLEDEPRPLRPVAVEVDPHDATHIRLTLTEGRNRQIRRMCASRGRKVLALRRVAIGPIGLGNLAPGATRSLGEAEVAALAAAVGLTPGPRRPGASRRRPA
jgi:23S rRNA pseudouridine2605 synthase